MPLDALWPLEGAKICGWRNKEGAERSMVHREEPEPHVAWAKVLYLERQGSTANSQGGWATPQRGLMRDAVTSTSTAPGTEAKEYIQQVWENKVCNTRS